jgi:hypothetical protein
MTAQKPSIYGRFPTPEKAKPWKLGQAALRSLAHLLLEASGIATQEAGDDHA